MKDHVFPSRRFRHVMRPANARHKRRYAFPHRFSTKWQDNETLMCDYGYRWYWPDLGRWLNRDPIGEEGGENLYGFCNNASVSHFDYLGYAVSYTYSSSKNDGWSLSIVLPIQIIDCVPDRERVSDQTIQETINRTWTKNHWFTKNVKVQKLPNVVELVKQDFVIKITMDASVTTVSDSEALPDMHKFYLVNQVTGFDQQKNRIASSAEHGGKNARILLEDRNRSEVFAHEVGHWLGLLDTYYFPSFDTSNLNNNQKSRPRPGYEDNVMADINGTKLTLWQLEAIRDFLSKGVLSQNIGLVGE